MKTIAKATLRSRQVLAALARKRRPHVQQPALPGPAPEKDLLQRLREAGL